MISRRKPKRDDRHIFSMIQEALVPYTRRSFPDFKLKRKEVHYRLSKARTWCIRPDKRHCRGFISYIVRGKQLWIDMLAIDRQYRRKGWGAKLLDQAERRARLNSCSEILLYVDETNIKAQRFYMYHGYYPLNHDSKLKCYLYVKQVKQVKQV